MTGLRIVVFGATGNQGGAVVRSLLQAGCWNVVAITRKPMSADANSLSESGAQIYCADPASQHSVLKAVVGAFGVFFLSQPWMDGGSKCDPSKEIIQGKNIIWACRQQKIKHVVFSSIINPDGRETGVPHFDSKLHLEQLLKSCTGWTVIRPGIFMDNIGSGFMPLKGCFLTGSLRGDIALPLSSYNDVGNCTAAIFRNTAVYNRCVINIAGDLRTGYDLTEMLETAKRRKKIIYIGAPYVLVALFQPSAYRIRRYFERLSSIEMRKQVYEMVETSRSQFPNLQQFANFISRLTL